MTNTAQPQTFDPRAGSKSDYFWYAARQTGLSSVAPTGLQIINLDADSFFYCVALTQVTDIGGVAYTDTATPIPLVTLQITDTGTGKALMNTPLLISGMTGDGRRPYRFVRPRVFQPNASIQLAFNAGFMAAGTTYNIQVQLHGYKVCL